MLVGSLCVLQCVAAWRSVLQCVVVCCSVLQCGADCVSATMPISNAGGLFVLQCVAV